MNDSGNPDREDDNDCFLCHETMDRPISGPGRRAPIRAHPVCWVRYSNWAARRQFGGYA